MKKYLLNSDQSIQLIKSYIAKILEKFNKKSVLIIKLILNQNTSNL